MHRAAVCSGLPLDVQQIYRRAKRRFTRTPVSPVRLPSVGRAGVKLMIEQNECENGFTDVPESSNKECKH